MIPLFASGPRGPRLQRQTRQAQYFAEDLGNGIELDMILIEGGEFEMGSPDDEPGRYAWEGPQHRVKVPTFFMGRYPVTQMQWRAVAAMPQANQALKPEPAYFKGDNRPVESVSWYDATEFCARLSAYTMRPYRLPSEAEWEYACRAGTSAPFYFGKMITTQLANCTGTSSDNKKTVDNYQQETTPVDYFEFSNAWGLSDMHGNVYEWCLDNWHNSYEGAPTDGSAWLNDEDSSRVRRGGSWNDNPRDCRSAFRVTFVPANHAGNVIGFRVVCSAPSSFL